MWLVSNAYTQKMYILMQFSAWVQTNTHTTSNLPLSRSSKFSNAFTYNCNILHPSILGGKLYPQESHWFWLSMYSKRWTWVFPALLILNLYKCLFRIQCHDYISLKFLKNVQILNFQAAQTDKLVINMKNWWINEI